MHQDHQTAPPRPRRKKTRHPRFAVGDRVHFAEGTTTGTGTVDAVTSDYAIVWVWTDEGQGRRMFLQGCGSIISSVAGEETDDAGA
ncbi:hypothetical protein Achl_1040 [Pseudarthrobacter chlorophenolicus A6]|uniref:DUF1918 domain-containing protein n=1 Tax=Pseudarthrobacter chlorophenolicus (strain ATCC 700700 / DSM 12829 / CIP 107037 / JCM 12360 / KCTC 9906 / NCIMB 13794 / A6) TaxID=452863 RepID=B8HDZ9_PSECP|nr:hypothetical protein [Pseudarthrobacter chlorophenolicus]ACL39034.1 hypothetical protein Achl_1040 [Pseudarthrobacter chlorophenolicus A6]SDR05315.1 hypothetical protein SAMN04489738_4489 [Pseudarthrobacter chlorophenolicus]